MSAFGRKNGAGGMAPGSRPSFGVAKPMRGGAGPGPSQGAAKMPGEPGGEQFPPIPADVGENAAANGAAAPAAGGNRRDDARPERILRIDKNDVGSLSGRDLAAITQACRRRGSTGDQSPGLR